MLHELEEISSYGPGRPFEQIDLTMMEKGDACIQSPALTGLTVCSCVLKSSREGHVVDWLLVAVAGELRDGCTLESLRITRRN